MTAYSRYNSKYTTKLHDIYTATYIQISNFYSWVMNMPIYTLNNNLKFDMLKEVFFYRFRRVDEIVDLVFFRFR